VFSDPGMSSSNSSFASSHFQTFDITIETVDLSKSVTIHGVKSKNASLPGLLLLHGHPQTHHIWWKVAPALAEKYNVVIPDLRGHGESSKPAPADDIKHETYSKRALARDQIMLMYVVLRC
jgi:haloacetate dehalogenase